VRANLGQLSGPSDLVDAAAPALRNQHYTTREIVVAESIVRAVTVLYLRDTVSDAVADRSLSNHVNLGFVWTTDLVDALDQARAAANGTLDDEALVTAATVSLELS
jgi:hypothetical protein